MRTLMTSLAVAAAALATSPAIPQAPVISVSCLERLAGMALTNPNESRLDRGAAVPLGLMEQGGPAYPTHQLQFQASNGGHILGVNPAQPAKLLFMWDPTPSGERVSTRYMFVADRRGRLLAAGFVQNHVFAPLETDDSSVRTDFSEVLSAWTIVPTATGGPPICSARS